MPIYAYRGVTAAGKAMRGSLTAENLRVARARMRGDGIILTEINETQPSFSGGTAAGGGARFKLTLLQRIPGLELALATRQLATLVGAGIPLVDALGALVEQVEHARLKQVLGEVRTQVNEGAALADAMAQSRQFDTLYVSMIRAGEAGGALELVLARIADYLEDQVRLQNKVSSILIYPAVMLFFAMIVVVALVTSSRSVIL